MPKAARTGDLTSHPGIVVGTSVNVLIGGLPAATIGDPHFCAFPGLPPHSPTPLAKASKTVLIGGRGAAREGDTAGCGSVILSGAPNVLIGD